MPSWVFLLLTNTLFVNLIGIDLLGKNINFRDFIKKIFFNFFLLTLLYSLSYPIFLLLKHLNLPYFIPFFYLLFSYGIFFLVDFFKRKYDYNLIEKSQKIKNDCLFESLVAGIYFFTLSFTPSFLFGILIIFTSLFSYVMAFFIWKGILFSLKREIFSSLNQKYLSYYFSITILILFFSLISSLENFY